MNKSELLQGVREEYRQWEALLDQIGEARMDQPGAAADWSIKDIIAHLTGWRHRTVARLQAAQRGEGEPPSPWPAHLQADVDLDEINAWIYESNHGRSVREVLDESHHVFQQMFAAIEGLPDAVLSDPARYLPWLEAESVKPSDFFAHFHEFDAKGETEQHADKIIKPDKEPARLNFFVGVFLPAVVVSPSVFSDLVEDLRVLHGFDPLCQTLIDMIFGDLCLLKENDFLANVFA